MNHPRWRVVELFDPRDTTLPRAVFACRVNESQWRIVWQHREISYRVGWPIGFVSLPVRGSNQLNVFYLVTQRRCRNGQPAPYVSFGFVKLSAWPVARKVRYRIFFVTMKNTLAVKATGDHAPL